MIQLPSSLEEIMHTTEREPKLTVMLWDVLYSADTLSMIVQGTATQSPYDVSAYFVSVRLTERSGLTASQLDLQLSIDTNELHPEFGAKSRYIEQGQVITVDIGDARVPGVTVRKFTGWIVGQPGYLEGDRDRPASVSLQAYGRAYFYNRSVLSSKQYQPNQYLSDIMTDYGKTYMGLADSEILIDNPGKSTGLPVAFVQESPTTVMNRALWVMNREPRFRGDGKLVADELNPYKSPARIYEDNKQVKSIEIPKSIVDRKNRIVIYGLDPNLTKVASNKADTLASARVTTGWFSSGERIRLWWSDDHTKRADNASLRIKKSINSGLLAVGDEFIENIDAYGCDLVIRTPWNPGLYTILTIVYIGSAAISDAIVGAGIGAIFGTTIPIGRIIQAGIEITVLSQMMKMANGEYDVVGYYYEMVHQEIRSEIIESNTDIWAENIVEYRNQLISSQMEADMLADREYRFEWMKSRPRTLRIVPDLALEPKDVLLLKDGRRYMIDSITQEYNQGGGLAMTLNCWRADDAR